MMLFESKTIHSHCQQIDPCMVGIDDAQPDFKTTKGKEDGCGERNEKKYRNKCVVKDSWIRRKIEYRWNPPKYGALLSMAFLIHRANHLIQPSWTWSKQICDASVFAYARRNDQ